MACPPVPLPSTSSTQLGCAVLGPSLFLLIFIFLLDSWEFVENQPVCHIYQWVAHPTPGGVCNHCERMMEGLTLDDVIVGNREGSLTEDEIVDYVQSGDPNHRDWDDWPLRMTFRINSVSQCSHFDQLLSCNRRHTAPPVHAGYRQCSTRTSLW